MNLTLTHCAVVRVNKEDKSHQVVFKTIGNYATKAHFRLIHIPVNLFKIIETPEKAMSIIKTLVLNIYQQSFSFYRSSKKGEVIMNKHKAHLAAQLMKYLSDFNLNTSSEQLTALKKQSHFSDFYLARTKY
jgi:hypothetical protein